MASTKKIIAVVGATGTQGSSVARAFASADGWQVRGLSRNPTSPQAKALVDIGCEVVQADLSDPNSLAKAFSGVHAIFLNTDFLGPYIAALFGGAGHEASAKIAFDAEVLHGKNAINAAKKVPTLECLVYSAFGPMKRASGGKYSRCEHFNTKGAIVDYIETEQPEFAKRVSLIYPGTYATNGFFYPRLDAESGEYVSVVPTSKEGSFPILDPAKSMGPFVRSLIENEKVGTKLKAYESYVTLKEAVDTWSKVTGKPAKSIEMTPEAMHELTSIPLEILDGPGYITDFGYYAGIQGAIEPSQMKSRPETVDYETYLTGRDLEGLLSGPNPDFAAFFKDLKV